MGKRVEDGTEFRDATVRTREGGIAELAGAMQDMEFFRVHGVRVSRLGDQLYFEFSANVKRGETMRALSIDMFLDVSDVPPRKVEEDAPSDG